ncbi:MAG: GNAT family N-acetyltransferase [Balneolaceae bacterium]|nr:MAG: GNAT family N-acetyltransferase [Balneolaceae bacterium]
MKELTIVEADLTNKAHTDAIFLITDAYARDAMGLGEPLPQSSKEKLISELREFPGTLCFIAFSNGKAAGLANCFYTFSTFKAAKVINVHDLAVMPEFRSMGIGQALLGAVEKKALETSCCKVTLEVREDNRARGLYERFGFSYGEPTMYFMTKELD